MEFYKDLTYYSKLHFENALNIGWINETNTFIKGKTPDLFLQKLEEYILEPFNTTRGYLKCDLCKSDSFKISILNQDINLGFSEIRVISEDGKQRFAAPDMIYHYIKDHNYSPPIEFIEAVINGPKPNSKKYQRFIKRYKKEFLWGEDEETVKTTLEIENKILSNNITAEKILSKNPNFINLVTKNGSLLNVAIKAKNLKLALFLLKQNLDINKFNGIELTSAIDVFENHLIEFLISKGIKIDLTTWSNPLFKAISIGNIDAVEILIKNGIDYQIEYSNPYVKNMNAIKFAAYCKKDDIANFLKNISVK
ncbi:hypothetical protein ASE40_18300 [Flavobacterium sp. Root935]|uniref:ankyrin repeat domain-containing protein n=1 Tax=Flavobacterium sp. Root935 TaxID=1736610 RepID=UPI000709EA91|nr:ankyrin repeat domain-containing protein [Flavobacterium sp. Root935]KRD58285.1 hypothetical protein ASE40_18300 [Flavobacterium sp. Root935]